jgi:CheY-like chemotaxis protein/DNA-directed RNA polymerase specialized sigma24 family protein
MTQSTSATALETLMSLSREIGNHLPFLRRYARALTGSQTRGDAYVRAALEAILQSPEKVSPRLVPRVALYRVFHVLWAGTHHGRYRDRQNGAVSSDGLVDRITALNWEKREAFLLTAMEDFTVAETAAILDRRPDEVARMTEEAIIDLAAQKPTSVLIIEDEPVISLDLSQIVEEMGHSIAAVARTRREAMGAAARTRPGLILADIQLAGGDSGIETVNEILDKVDAPVIYVTAYPERLLTGEGTEPTFMVTKPFSARNVRAAVGQALLLAEEAEPQQLMHAAAH